jgi:hypothetical protein
MGAAGATGAAGTSGGAAGPGNAGSTGAATGSAGTGGVPKTCGNGSVDPGEDCEGSNLNGGSCTSLGFQSGTLACASSCRYDTSACQAPLTLTVTPSRTSCSAPCGVFFDATGTTGLSGGDFVAANFDWDFDSTNVDPNGVHERGIGFATGHVFDVPGSYQVSVRVRDAAGQAGSTTIPITVSALTGTTIYVSAKGSDSNAGTSMSQPLATVAAAIKKVASNVSILFRRGDSFSIGGSSVDIAGPCLIGAYTDPASPSTAAPIWTSTTTGTFKAIVGLSGTDARIVDIHIASGGASNGISLGGTKHALVERLEIDGLGYVDSSSGTVGENFYSDGACDASFFVDANLHDFKGYAMYADTVSRLAFVGNQILRFGGGDHGLRVAGGNLSYIAENTIVSNDTNSAQSGITIRGNNQKIVVANNHSNRLIEFTPQNTSSVEKVMDALAEGNLINDSRTTGMYSDSLGITAKHVIVRNNIFVNNPNAVGISGQPQLPVDWVDQIFVYNNTGYFFPTNYNPDLGATFLSAYSTTGKVVVENNIFAQGLALTNSQTNLVATDRMGTVTEDHNLCYGPNGTGGTWKPATGAGSFVGDPKFVSTDVTSPNAFHLSAGSAALDVGAMVPVYRDFAATSRPSGSGWDIGAFELAP